MRVNAPTPNVSFEELLEAIREIRESVKEWHEGKTSGYLVHDVLYFCEACDSIYANNHVRRRWDCYACSAFNRENVKL